MRTEFTRLLGELRDAILLMGSHVDSELDTALAALATFDQAKVRAVFEADRAVNRLRFDIEERCFTLIATQQPTAGDLRRVVAAMSMVVDIERMGDQAKGIAKAVSRLTEPDLVPRLPELQSMSDIVRTMLRKGMQAYSEGNVVLAQSIAASDDVVDNLYGEIYAKIMSHMAERHETKEIEAAYEILRVARELERFADLITNLAERTIYLSTGAMYEINVEAESRR